MRITVNNITSIFDIDKIGIHIDPKNYFDQQFIEKFFVGQLYFSEEFLYKMNLINELENKLNNEIL